MKVTVPVPRKATTQLVPAPVPVPRVQGKLVFIHQMLLCLLPAEAQSTSAPVPVPQTGVTGLQQVSPPIPAPRMRPAEVQSTLVPIPVLGWERPVSGKFLLLSLFLG